MSIFKSKFNFIKNSIQSYLNEINEDNEINKILIYGCASYLSKEDLINCLSQILKNLTNLKNYLLKYSNLMFAKEFYDKRKVFDFNLEDEKSNWRLVVSKNLNRL